MAAVAASILTKRLHLGKWVPGHLGTWASGHMGVWAPGQVLRRDAVRCGAMRCGAVRYMKLPDSFCTPRAASCATFNYPGCQSVYPGEPTRTECECDCVPPIKPVHPIILSSIAHHPNNNHHGFTRPPDLPTTHHHPKKTWSIAADTNFPHSYTVVGTSHTFHSYVVI